MENFKPRARILKLLGEELIGSQHLALFELIKNAYDADADNIYVNIDNVENIKETTITVKDNGCGMTLDTIKNSWLEPGTDNKEKLIEKKIRTPKYGRFPLGSKGVGRFAAYKLGDIVTLYTKSVKDGELKLSIDLNEVLERKYLDEFLVNIEKVPSSESHIKTETGTEIIISDITNEITFTTVSNLNKQILSIQSPFELYGEKNKKIKNPIKIELICPEYQNRLKTTNIKDIVEESLYRFNFKFEEGKLEYEYIFTPNKFLQKSTGIIPRKIVDGKINNITTIDKDKPVKESKYYKSLNKIEGVFYVYDFDNKILQYYQNKSAIKTYTSENCGVRVYREGMRVYNYGEKGNDWLELDQGRIDDPAKNLSNRLIIGGIELDPKTITVLREKTNREGFIEDEEYNKFKIVIKSILSVFNKERVIDKNNLKIILDGNYKETITNIQKPILELKAIARQFNVYKEMDKQIDKIEKAYNQMRDIMLNSGLKGLNTALAVHEIEKSLYRLKRAIENRDSNLIKTEMAMSLRLMDGIADLLKKDPVRKYKASTIIKNVLNLSEDRFKRHNIKIICPILNDEKNDFEINVPKRMILSSLINLVDNAIYWLSVRWYREEDIDRKKIYINAEYVDDELAIVVVDNGTGIPKGDREELFKPFVTTKPMGVGMGLGLYYVKTAMDAINGEVLFLEPEKIKETVNDDNCAGIALIFKE